MIWITAFTLFTGCKVPEEAPEDLGEPTLKLFELFDGDEDVLQDYMLALNDFLLTQDLENEQVNSRSYAPGPLTTEFYGNITGPGVATEDEQSAVAVLGLSEHAIDQHRQLVRETNQVCIESATTKYYSREFLSNVDCYVSGGCDTLQTINEVRKEAVISNLWYDLHKDYRQFELPDGREAAIARSWTEQVFPGDKDNTSLLETFALEAWIEHPDDSGKTMRVYALWSSVEGVPVGTGALSALAKTGIDQGFAYVDAFISGDDTVCKVDRDREYDRPSDDE